MSRKTRVLFKSLQKCIYTCSIIKPSTVTIIILVFSFSTGWQNCHNILRHSWDPVDSALLVEYRGRHGKCVQVFQTFHIFPGHSPFFTFIKILNLTFKGILLFHLHMLMWDTHHLTLTANIGRFTYWKICCYVYVKKSKKRRRRMLNRQRA